MKQLFYLLLCCCAFSAYGNNRTFSKLSEVNKCWAEQPDISPDALPGYRDQSETEWIRTHLQLVEATLRLRDVQHLTPAQQRNRMQCLDHLHTYWQTGNFPVNDAYSFRTPIFIDKYDNFCAVGYLVKASGYEGISRMIAAKTNLAYVRQMHYPELNQWAVDNGFTTSELAWIQPGYPPSANCMPVGGGVNGVVNELYADEAAGKLYVGGSFTQADGFAAANVAYITQSASGAYTWHKMGTGLPGVVNAITKFEGKIVAAGTFAMPGVGTATSAVAFWDGTNWTSAGCLNGTVKDLAVHNGVLYACGEIDDCSGLFAPQYFAKWDGTSWHSIDGPWGRVNTMEVAAGSLVLGGAFSYMGTPVNILKWTASATFQPYTNGINNEVMDITVFGDTLHAVCKRTHATDTTTLLLKLRNDAWSSAVPEYAMTSFYPHGGTLSFNTLYADAFGLNAGGRFEYMPMLGTYARNCYNWGDYSNWVMVDSTVNKMEVFNGKLIIGGAFKTGNGAGWGGSVSVNGITARSTASAAVQPVLGSGTQASVFPNPVDAGSVITVGGFDARQYTLHHITGRNIASGELHTPHSIYLPHMPAGIYMLTLTDAGGKKTVQKLQVK